MSRAGVRPTVAEYDALPNTVRQALGFVSAWREEQHIEHQMRMLQGSQSQSQSGGGRGKRG